MKKLFSFIFLSLLLVLTSANGASAMSDSAMLHKIINRPIYYQELRTINYLIFTKNVNFTVKDLRELLRNWIGKPSGAAASGNVNIINLGETKVQYTTKINSKYCVNTQYVLQGDKIIKEKLLKQYCPFRPSMRKRKFIGYYTAYTYLYYNRPGHLKKFAFLVNKILKKYPGVYKNINSQGRHYQTALYIASARGMSYVLYFLLKDKYINPAITSISQGLYNAGYLTPYLNNYKLYDTNINHAGHIAGYVYTNSTNQLFPIMVFLRNINQPSSFDLMIQKRLLKLTESKTNNFYARIGYSPFKSHVRITFHRIEGGHVYSIEHVERWRYVNLQ